MVDMDHVRAVVVQQLMLYDKQGGTDQGKPLSSVSCVFSPLLQHFSTDAKINFF